MLRRISSYQRASFRPKVIGSAWMPWVRPICTVCLNSMRAAVERDGAGSCAPFIRRTRGLLQHQRLRGIDDVVRGQAVMQPAGGVGVAGGGHFFGDGGGEGDDVVLDFALDFVDAGDVEAGVGAQGCGGFGWDFAGFGQGFARGQLHFEPLREAVFVGEDAAHFGARVAGNHVLVGRNVSVGCLGFGDHQAGEQRRGRRGPARRTGARFRDDYCVRSDGPGSASRCACRDRRG